MVMKLDLDSKRYKLFTRIEFWLATMIFVLAWMALFSEAGDDPLLTDAGSEDGYSRIVSYYLIEFIQIVTIYLSFLLLNFRVVPRLIKKEKIVFHIALIVAVFFALGIAFGSLDIGFAPLTAFAIYSIIKYTALLIWINADAVRTRFKFLAPGVMLAVPLLIVSIIFLVIADVHHNEIIAWSVIMLGGILMYSYSFLVLIPRAQEKKRPRLAFMTSFILIILVAEVFIGFLSLALSADEDMPLAIVVMHTFFQILFIAPLSWIVYRRSEKTEERISSLEKELGQSTASFDFLRSQINPHFLFNALNTLYGTALQENAERTAEGIQKLGDMMRFMLQENMQQKISLTREVDYLKNYINLQKLRTEQIPSITIITNIEESIQQLEIAPMLLIPFVENAFKHGISFREPSYIKISLYVQEKVLYFDVSNSIHRKSDSDPEKDKSGIGLANVKQRLALLYRKKHELTIRESEKEFFVQLSIQLS